MNNITNGIARACKHYRAGRGLGATAVIAGVSLCLSLLQYAEYRVGALTRIRSARVSARGRLIAAAFVRWVTTVRCRARTTLLLHSIAVSPFAPRYSPRRLAWPTRVVVADQPTAVSDISRRKRVKHAGSPDARSVQSRIARAAHC